MRDEEFKQRLSEVCEWEIPVTMESTEQGRENRRKHLDKLGQDVFNATFPPKIREIKHLDQVCDDCGQTVKGRHKELRIWFYQNKRYLKEHCKTCDLHKDPYTGKFTIKNGTQAGQSWVSYARYKTHYKAKG